MAKSKAPSDADPRWVSNLRPAPGDLRIVQAFLNTVDFGRQSDFASPRALADWLEMWGLVPPATRLDKNELERAKGVREALRSVILAQQHATEVNEGTIVRLDREMAAAAIRARFGAGGRVRLESAAGGLDAALARLGAVVAVAQSDGTWSLMKICGLKNCNAAFFDFSTNHSAKWCSARCGSRSTSLADRHRNLERIRDINRRDAFYRRY